jgi:hypothetical protein
MLYRRGLKAALLERAKALRSIFCGTMGQRSNPSGSPVFCKLLDSETWTADE